MIPCKVCKEPMPELRLTKFGYKVCVNCSTTSAYRAINTTNGTGDHTWNDRIEESKEDNNLQGPLTIIKTD